MRQDFPEVAHIEPAIAVGPFDEVLPLVLRFATKPLSDDLARHDARTVGGLTCSPKKETTDQAGCPLFGRTGHAANRGMTVNEPI